MDQPRMRQTRSPFRILLALISARCRFQRQTRFHNLPLKISESRHTFTACSLPFSAATPDFTIYRWNPMQYSSILRPGLPCWRSAFKESTSGSCKTCRPGMTELHAARRGCMDQTWINHGSAKDAPNALAPYIKSHIPVNNKINMNNTIKFKPPPLTGPENKNEKKRTSYA